MPANLTPFRVVDKTPNASLPETNLVQAIEDALNNIGGPLTSWAPGPIIGLDQLKTGGAASGDIMALTGGSVWAKSTPPPGVTVTLISDLLLAVPATFDFTAIPATYKHLRLVMYWRSDRAAAVCDYGMRFNGDNAANYDGYSRQFSGAGGTVKQANEQFAATSGNQYNAMAGTSSPAHLFTATTILIPHYANTANNKIAYATNIFWGSSGGGGPRTAQGLVAWRSNTAIAQITFIPITGGTNFVAGSRASLYGIG